jgi:hypothetical protein
MKIEKIIPILLMVLMPTPITYAGHLKVMGGLNLSKYAGPLFYPQDAWKFRTGFEGGVGYEIRLGPHFSLEIDGMFIQKGSLREYKEQGLLYYTIHYALNELNFPVLLKLSVKKMSSPYVLAGGEFSYILSSDVTVIGIERYPPPWPEPPKTKSFYPGLVFGGGFSWDMGKISLFVEVRLHLGLENIVKYGSDHIKPRSIVLLLGLDYK